MQIEASIYQKFLPAVFEYTISTAEYNLFSLPANLGGLGVINPTEMFEISYSSSRSATDVIIQGMSDNCEIMIDARIGLLHEV